MVGPSVTDSDRERFLRRLRIGFALFVGGSMALVTLYGDAGPASVAVALVAGTLVGALLAYYVLPDGSGFTSANRGER